MISARRYSDERGQVMLFGILVFFALFITVGVIVNTANVAYYKMQLQNAADASAMAGAAYQAKVMTSIIGHQKNIRDTYTEITDQWSWRGPGTLLIPYDTEADAQDDIEYWEGKMEIIRAQIDRLNTQGSVQAAKQAAETMAWRNIHLGHTIKSYLGPNPTNPTHIVTLRSMPYLKKLTYWVKKDDFPWREKKDHTFAFWFERKRGDPMTWFGVKITAPGIDADQMLFGSFLEVEDLPEFEVYSLAKPYGGFITPPHHVLNRYFWLPRLPGPSEDEYYSWLVKISDNRLDPRPKQLHPDYKYFEH